MPGLVRYVTIITSFVHFFFCDSIGEVKSPLQVECSLMADMAKEIVQTNGYSNGDYIFFYVG